MYGIPQRLTPIDMRLIPKAQASFFVQILEAASNTSEFILKRVFGLMEILHHEPINVERIILENNKAMVDAPQGACGHFCIGWQVYKVIKMKTSSHKCSPLTVFSF